MEIIYIILVLAVIAGAVWVIRSSRGDDGGSGNGGGTRDPGNNNTHER